MVLSAGCGDDSARVTQCKRICDKREMCDDRTDQMDCIDDCTEQTYFSDAYVSEWARCVAPDDVSCNVARLKCAYRASCGLALQSYVIACQDLSKGRTDTCNTHCKHALIALMSTHEGKRLMKVRMSCYFSAR